MLVKNILRKNFFTFLRGFFVENLRRIYIKRFDHKGYDMWFCETLSNRYKLHGCFAYICLVRDLLCFYVQIASTFFLIIHYIGTNTTQNKILFEGKKALGWIIFDQMCNGKLDLGVEKHSLWIKLTSISFTFLYPRRLLNCITFQF